MRLQLQRLVNTVDNADSGLSVWNCGVAVGFLFILSLSVFSILYETRRS